ncbi:hypothetical protein E2C01_086974 [Portunus trituberculatus]|uniref:Uncharacterized protein n=1 Tax=Portunus trituberculatus TaxID=210409 RepID=A0A5B7J282_PORTR|nr:hypothetical protein [Portunus trituberculatus]
MFIAKDYILQTFRHYRRCEVIIGKRCEFGQIPDLNALC